MEKERATGLLLGIADGMEAQGKQRVATTIREAAMCLADEPTPDNVVPVKERSSSDQYNRGWEAGVQAERRAADGDDRPDDGTPGEGGDRVAEPNRMTREAMHEDLDGATRYDSAEALAEDMDE